MFLSKAFNIIGSKLLIALFGLSMIVGTGALVMSSMNPSTVVKATKGSDMTSAHTIYLTDNFNQEWGSWAGTVSNFRVNVNYNNKSQWDLITMTKAYDNDLGQAVYTATLPAKTSQFEFAVHTSTQNDKWSTKITREDYDFDSILANDDQEFYWDDWSGSNFTTTRTTIYKYKINYHANGGSGTMTSDDAYTHCNWGVKENEFERSGYTFQKWCNSPLGEGDLWIDGGGLYNRTTTSTADLDLYAVWIPDSIRLVWNNQSNNKWIHLWDSSHSSGTFRTLQGTAFTANGTSYYYYDFDYSSNGWIPDHVIFANDSQQTGNLIVPVKSWTGAYYFELSGVTVGSATMTSSVYKVSKNGINGTVTANSYGTYGSPLSISWTKASATGYDYNLVATKVYAGTNHDGALLKSATTGTSTTFTMGDIFEPNIFIETEYSKTAKTFTISYNKNGGSGSTMSTSTLTYDAAFTLRTNSYTYDGHIFASWNTAANGSGTNYTSMNLTQIQVNALFSSGNRTLYAIWTSGETAAIAFATDFNSKIGGVCDNDGRTTDTSDLASKWATQKSNYAKLKSYERYWLDEAHKSSNENVITMLGNGSNIKGKYDYVCGKYGANGKNVLGLDPDFLGRNPSVPASSALVSYVPDTNQSPLTLTLWIVLGAGILGMGAIGTAYFVSKKKKKGDRAAS